MRGGWARRGLSSLARLVTSVAAFEESERRGLLQAIDARAKVIGLIGLVVVVTLVHSFAALVAAYGACILLAVFSRVPAKRFAGVWIVVPLFSAAIMLPATLNLVTDGRPVWVLWKGQGSVGPWRLPELIAVTDSGLLLAARFVLRSAVCVTLALLLASTTRPARLFRGLRMLGMPRVFVSMLTMMERYLTVLARTAQEIHTAKISRTIRPKDLRREHAWVAAGIGSLYRRTHSLGQEVYLAMLSRGYTGDVRLLDEPRFRARDWVFLALIAVFATGLIIIR